MKRLGTLLAANQNAMVARSLFLEPLTEIDILLLQDKFLTPGFHHIQLKNKDSGRVLIENFLESLHCYNTVACLTLSHELLPSSATDIYFELITSHYINNLEQFFLDQFYYDFLWIEASSDLLKMEWYQEFEHYIIDYKLDQQIPIIVLSYQE